MSTVFVLPWSLRVGEFVVLVSAFGLSTLAVFARIYTKARLLKEMKLEDYICLLAWMGFMGCIGLAIVISNHEGRASHTAFLSAVEATYYRVVIVVVKVSILLQYITIFTPHKKGTFYYLTHIVIWTNLVYYTIITILTMNSCSPREKLWIPTISGYCINSKVLGVTSGVLNVVSDFSILILPLPLIWRLQMPRNKKIRVTAVFGLGLFACITSVLCLIYTIEVIHNHGPAFFMLMDNKVAMLCFAEIVIGLILGCSPVLPKFFQQLSLKRWNFSRLFKVVSNDSGRSYWFGSLRKSSSSNPDFIPTRSFTQRFHTSSRDNHIAALNLSRASFPSRLFEDQEQVKLFSLGDAETNSQFHHMCDKFERDRDQARMELRSPLVYAYDEKAIFEIAHREGEVMTLVNVQSMIRPVPQVYNPTSPRGKTLVPNML